jgi:hypothetical protein
MERAAGPRGSSMDGGPPHPVKQNSNKAHATRPAHGPVFTFLAQETFMNGNKLSSLF